MFRHFSIRHGNSRLYRCVFFYFSLQGFWEAEEAVLEKRIIKHKQKASALVESPNVLAAKKSIFKRRSRGLQAKTMGIPRCLVFGAQSRKWRSFSGIADESCRFSYRIPSQVLSSKYYGRGTHLRPSGCFPPTKLGSKKSWFIYFISFLFIFIFNLFISLLYSSIFLAETVVRFL